MKDLICYQAHAQLPLTQQLSYLVRKHGTEIVTTRSQHYPMSRKLLPLNVQRHITKSICLPQIVHSCKDGFCVAVSKNLAICHIDSFNFMCPSPQHQTLAKICLYERQIESLGRKWRQRIARLKCQNFICKHIILMHIASCKQTL